MEEAKSKLRMQEVAGTTNRGRGGLGLNPKEILQPGIKERKEDHVFERS